MKQIESISSMPLSDGAPANVIRQRRFKHVNLSLVIVAGLITLIGLVVVFSAVANDSDYSFARQSAFVAVGVALMFALFRVDYRKLGANVILLTVISLLLTLLPHVPFLGTAANGANSWVSFGGLGGFQPGELAKVTVILAAAGCVARYNGQLDDVREYLKCVGIMLVPILGIMTQPDLGTAMVYLFIDAVALLMGGAKPKYLIATVGVIALAVFALFMLDPVLDKLAGSDTLLKDYQKARLLVFVNNDYDPTGDGYNLQQAKIAIGSGGFFGKGFMNATQSTLGYLPEAPTDFIFCVLAEEFGFMGSMALLVLYAVLIIKSYGIAKDAPGMFGCLLVMCIAGMWLFQILENIGMDLGLMPITGIPLPFVSYGSSFMIVNFILLGLVGSVWARSER